jgi:peptidoglycan/xylan/chitin deacetylase (PgdA/CDA1 family)
MIGSVWVSVGIRPWAALCLGLFTCISAQKALAEDCPGHPDALGTSRTLVVDPREHPRIGTMQYHETLPLADHEVVLTFDDGPLPRNSNQILEILASQCVKATFFEIGQMARAYPEGVRKLRDAGHSIGTHSQNHPLTMNRMPIERAKQEIDDGIASVKAALGDDTTLAPFFRIPGLLRAADVEDYLASQGIQIWSADFPADDWRHISSSRVYDLAIKRIEAKGKGILLLHDIQPRTVAALPKILQTLKAAGYHIVHVVPATPDLAATPTEPQQWQLHPPSEDVASAHWPRVVNFAYADVGSLPAPELSDWDWHDGQTAPSEEPFERASRLARGVPLPPREAPWPRQSILPLDTTSIALPVPAPSTFEFKEKPHLVAQAVASSSRRDEPAVKEHETNPKLTSADDGDIRQMTHGRFRHGRARQRIVSRIAGRRTHLAAHAHRGTPHHPVQVKKVARGGSVRHNL